jgi:hypothetical protein
MNLAYGAPLLAGVIVAAAVSHTGGSKEVAFAPHEIATGLRGGYQVVVADLNKDGRPDIIALAQGLPELVWYENPGWQRHVLVSGVSAMINVAAADVDGDGIPELALAQGFTTNPKTSIGIVSILTHGADPAQPWSIKEIDRVPTAHRLRWIDADGSGQKWLVLAPLVGPDAVAPDYKSPVSIYFYRPPEFKRETLNGSFSGLLHGIEPVLWPGVSGQALLSAGFNGIHLHRFGGRWSSSELTKGDPDPWPKSGTSDIALGHIGSRPMLGTIEPWHGNQVVVYTRTSGGWSRKMIDDQIENGHAIAPIDVDGDGSDEIVVGQRGGTHNLMLYTASADGGSWSQRVLDAGGMAGAGCAVADFNGDKRPDIVCIGTATANLKWYENLGRKRS